MIALWPVLQADEALIPLTSSADIASPCAMRRQSGGLRRLVGLLRIGVDEGRVPIAANVGLILHDDEEEVIELAEAALHNLAFSGRRRAGGQARDQNGAQGVPHAQLF